jgi:glutathione S-transferase
MNGYKLVSFDLCPFVQRSVITLEEKNVPYEITYIDLNAKPDWFLAISPHGKVPLLQVGDSTVHESAVINEYLDEVTPPGLHPEEPLQRALNRAAIEFASALTVDQYRLTVAQEQDKMREFADSAKTKLARVEAQLVGPFFNGDSFSLVDAAYAPTLQRFVWCESIEPGLAFFEKTPKVKAWTDALLARKSVKASTLSNIEEIFRSYLKGKGSPTRDVEPSWLGRQIEA